MKKELFINYAKRYSENPRHNIADLGKGIGNLTHLILKVYSALEEIVKEAKKEQHRKSDIPPKLILIEEPEAFLHPAFQSKLADFFVFCLKKAEKYNVKFIIETHSEYLIRKLQYLTAKDEIDPDITRIYYFHEPNRIPEGEKQIKELKIEKDGSLSDQFGPGFFDEATNIKFELLRRKKKTKN